ncbi:hypothetical protein A1704_17345 [Chryseobacterium cucumeris]|uniref:lanthionine synthetase LanC family protein n=1 Tax=Chryseobacterium cucumeris TaxID=1813611 RepID=UPI000786C938|nr:lanthionine synthetase LanC family protein [Chryseobacterium cucumeris]KYH04460.1 hypothetical protein A1704_17345 [Chryseobacterium cucumeris]
MERLHLKLKEINHVIKEEVSKENNVGILDGLSGIALFQFYYSKYLESENIYEDALITLQKCFEKINDGYSLPTFCSGIAGFGWTIDHLVENNFIELDNDELLSGFDEYIHNVMVFSLNKKNFDFLHGGIGYALYFINRYRNTSLESLKLSYKAKIYEFISLLESFADKTSNQYKWEKVSNGEKVYDLSLSHGMSSIIGILNKLYELPEFRDRVRDILVGTINFIVELHYLENKLSLYASTISVVNNKNQDNSRLAWCYGDLGIATVLLQSSYLLKSESLRKKVIYILEFSSKRKNLEENSVFDLGICHGTMGISHIFKNICHKLNTNTFQDTSKYWLNKGLELSIYDDNYLGVKKWDPSIKSFIPDLSLLEGAAGVGLVIINSLAPLNTKWDECLMLN